MAPPGGSPDDQGAARVPGPAHGLPSGRRLDEESRRWLDDLGGGGAARDDALNRLHQMLLRVGRAELRRRGGRHPITGPELDDLAHQAADDALVAITTKLSGFRGESRFTTWAYKFVVFEVSAKLGRHFWQRPTAFIDAGEWNRLPDRFGISPEDHAEREELISAVRRAVSEQLTAHQQQIFVALVVDDVPLDALVTRLGSNRNAIYKTMFDARRKLRAALVANGYLGASKTTGEHQRTHTLERRP